MLAALFMAAIVPWSAEVSTHQGVQRTDTISPRDDLPLPPGRVARFRVTEGTWMSLDVSSDGRTIVFDLLGHLYVLPIAGGTARQLTSGLSINRQPRFSPDGRQLVFVSDRSGSENVWITDRDGRHPRQISRLRGYDAVGAVLSPTWSPDGQTIVVAQRPGATANWPQSISGADPRSHMWLLAAYDGRTGQMRWLSDTAPSGVRSTVGPTFHPQRNVLYAAVNFEVRSLASTRSGLWRIGRLEVKSSRLSAETGGPVGRVGMRPLVSPNGRFLVYASSTGSRIGLRLRDLTTRTERWLIWEALDNPSEANPWEPRDHAPGYAFTPDSKSVIAAYGGKIHRIDLATGGTAIIPFVVAVERQLGSLTVQQFTIPDTAAPIHSVLHPALSPTGDRVAFSALGRIWIMTLPDSGRPASHLVRLTAASVGEFFPAWSPDGRWIAYTTWRDVEGGAVWRTGVPADARSGLAEPERLTTDRALYLHAAVEPHSKQIVAVRVDIPTDRALYLPSMSWPPRPVTPTLVRAPVRGGQPVRVASLPAVSDASLHQLVKQVYFTGDSSRIYIGLSSWGWDGASDSMALAVKDRSGLVHGEKEPRFINGVLSPNRQRALVAVGHLLYDVSLTNHQDTLDLTQTTQSLSDGSSTAARQWGAALMPWMSWSHDGRRVAFAQGRALYVGTVPAQGPITWQRVEVPLTVAPDVPRGVIVFSGGTLITMRGREVIAQGNVVVRNNRIVAVGPSGEVTIPRGARIVDARGMTILPGYVDVHEHVFKVRSALRQQPWESLLELSYGVTTVRDPSPGGDDIFALMDRERGGDLVGPRHFSTGLPYLGPYPPIRTLDTAREAVRRHAMDVRTETFKVYYDGNNTDRRARQLLAMAAREAGINATVHVNGLDHALAAIIDGMTGIEHDAGIRTYDDVAMLVAHSGATYTHTYIDDAAGGMAHVTQQYGLPQGHTKVRRFVPPSALESTCPACEVDANPEYAPFELDYLLPMVTSAARIVRHGGRVGIGAHGNAPGLGFHYEMWLHALGGMPNHDILRSATIVGATAIGHARDFGSLEPGKLADLQVLDANPLDDIHRTTSIRYVMKNGRLYQADDLTEILPRHRPLPSIYLWQSKP